MFDKGEKHYELGSSDEVMKLINKIDKTTSKIPLEIYEIVKNLSHEIINNEIHNETRKTILKMLNSMAKMSDDLVSESMNIIVNNTQKEIKDEHE